MQNSPPPFCVIPGKGTLVIPNYAMGDNIWSLVAGYKRKIIVPQSEVTYINWEKWDYIFSASDYIDGILRFSEKFYENPEEKDRFEHCIASACTVISLCQNERVNGLIGRLKRRGEYAIFTYPENKASRAVNSIYTDINGCINEFLGVQKNWCIPVAPPLHADEIEFARRFFGACNRARKRVALVSPGSAIAVKRFPAELTELICRFLGERGYFPVVIIPADGPGYLGRLPRDRISILEYNTRKVFALIASSDMFIGADSGFAHAASLYGVPTVTIFGATSLYFRPYGRKSAVVDVTGENCPHRCGCGAACLHPDSADPGRPFCFDEWFSRRDLEAALCSLGL
jgi:ADP-heptose:LPS heptosyltransferase